MMERRPGLTDDGLKGVMCCRVVVGTGCSQSCTSQCNCAALMQEEALLAHRSQTQHQPLLANQSSNRPIAVIGSDTSLRYTATRRTVKRARV